MYDFLDGERPVLAKRHINPDGSTGGWVAKTAYVDETSILDKTARVLGRARVLKNSIIGRGAVVRDDALIREGVTVHEKAIIRGNVTVRENAHVAANSIVDDKTTLESIVDKSWTLEPSEGFWDYPKQRSPFDPYRRYRRIQQALQEEHHAREADYNIDHNWEELKERVTIAFLFFLVASVIVATAAVPLKFIILAVAILAFLAALPIGWAAYEYLRARAKSSND